MMMMMMMMMMIYSNYLADECNAESSVRVARADNANESHDGTGSSDGRNGAGSYHLVHVAGKARHDPGCNVGCHKLLLAEPNRVP